MSWEMPALVLGDLESGYSYEKGFVDGALDSDFS